MPIKKKPKNHTRIVIGGIGNHSGRRVMVTCTNSGKVRMSIGCQRNKDPKVLIAQVADKYGANSNYVTILKAAVKECLRQHRSSTYCDSKYSSLTLSEQSVTSDKTGKFMPSLFHNHNDF